MMMEHAEEITELKVRPIEIRDDLDALLAVLPPHIEETLRRINRGSELLEVVMDLGRPPEARFVKGEVILSEKEVTQEDIDYVVSRISEFGEDNRAGIERTLHRISAIRNRKGRIVGLTCRVGRAVYGTVDIIRDIVESGKSILLLGRPGVGKTTMLREVARILAEKKRVVIVDTSNEIGGDGDIPHPAIGRARRMQVPTPALQHEVMIEAVENHMPEVIIIDEIGRELEAQAARTIAERGVQLIATAHGETLDNLMMNPTLADLVGGIESVTLSDEEAKRRGTQKTVLERRAPPTFDVVIEIKDWNRLAIHHDVAAAVDAILRGNPIPAEIRYRTEDGRVFREKATFPPPSLERAPFLPRVPQHGEKAAIKGYLYGLGENKVRQAARKLQVPFIVVKDLNQSDVFLTLKSFYRKRLQPIVEAERRGIPVYVLRSNTVAQIEECLADIFELGQSGADPLAAAMREAEEAIKKVLSGVPMVELSPQSAPIRRQQHLLAAQFNLSSYSVGKEPYRRVRIYREE